eukprot:TRINITY_DN5193_c0_g1_i2.p1 TRINITY_DN5193_c0_g1~~TRINITY_DN5193_c0_g1_i2.p1  ORF type:complete len:562 (+),score=209.30 TRINITY_DN5193_c0_g1_i2:619-2304(+)
MDNESNVKISNILDKVKQTWKLIGLNEEEKKRIIQEVTKKVIGEYSTLLREGEEKKMSLEKGIEEMMKEMNKTLSVLIDIRLEDEQREFSSLLEKHSYLKKKLEDITEIKEEREEKLTALHDTFVHLYLQMGETFDNCGVDPNKQLCKSDLSLENIGKYEKIVEEMENLKGDKMEIFDDRLNQIRLIEDQLKIDTETAFTPKLIKTSSSKSGRSNERDNLDLRWKELDNLKLVLENLNSLKEERMKRIKIYKKNIENLLKEMNFKPSESSNFLQKHQDLTLQCLKALETEENRLKQALTLQFESLIEKVFEEITKKYDILHTAEEERKKLPVITSSFEESQNILTSLREHLGVLCLEIESTKSIHLLITKRINLREKKNKLEELESDSSRLLSKKSNLIRLEEEKLRTEVTKLPKVESELIEKIQEWQKLYQKTFLYDGEEYIEVIKNDNNQDKMESLKKKEKRLFDKVNKENKGNTSSATLTIMEPLNQSIKVTQRTPSRQTPLRSTTKNPPSSLLETPRSKKPKSDTENTTPMRSTTRHNRDITNTPSQRTPVSKTPVP